LPKALGCADFTARVTTLGKLDKAMTSARASKSGAYIEIIGGKMDMPPALAYAHGRLKTMYGDTPLMASAPEDKGALPLWGSGFITASAPPVARSPASGRSLSATLFWPRLMGSCGLARRTFDGKNVSILVALMGVAHRLLDRSCLCAAGSPSDGDGGNRHCPYFAHRFRTLARTWRRGVALADHGAAPRPRRGHPNPYSACRGMDPS
jgi:hypothetical protein